MCEIYAQEIREKAIKYQNKNDRQRSFKQIMHRLYIECFGIKYKKVKAQEGKWANIKEKKLRTSQIM